MKLVKLIWTLILIATVVSTFRENDYFRTHMMLVLENLIYLAKIVIDSIK